MAVPLREQRLLLQKSGNRCAFPGCRRMLTAGGSPVDRPVVLGEVAHIVAESPDGPRGASPLPIARRNRYENLILLCNQHHQLVDSQPHTYTVERLLAMKEDHERWVERTLGRAGGNGGWLSEMAPGVTETVHSTLLPVERMPRYVYGVPCTFTDEREVAAQMRPLRGEEMAPFILRGGMLFAFQNLNDRDGPFASLVPGRSAERYDACDWWEDIDQMRWFVALLNRALNKLTGRRGLRLDKLHSRYYFQPEEPEKECVIVYRPLNRAAASRRVVWQPRSRRTGQPRGYWYHRAVSLRFLRAGTDEWCLSVRPELRVTVDGLNPAPSGRIGGKVTRKKSRMFNYDLLGEVNFWRDYLSDSGPRIILRFGPQQHIVISTRLLSGTVTWPGIPEEHAKSFTNVEYLDDLFTWAEFAELDAAGADWDEDEEWDGIEERDDQ
jgi:hypothetical protein